MPTNANAYNSRITDESLEKKFRDSFRSQGGAELVDDLYASGVIVPVIDFSSAASGSTLSQELQQAWDFTTGATQIAGTTTTLITNSGFWLVDLTATWTDTDTTSVTLANRIFIDDGTTTKTVWAASLAAGTAGGNAVVFENKFIVFLRANDELKGFSLATSHVLDVWYRQIADVSGNLVNPSGFTSS